MAEGIKVIDRRGQSKITTVLATCNPPCDITLTLDLSELPSCDNSAKSIRNYLTD